MADDDSFVQLYTEEFDRCAAVASRICGTSVEGEEVAMDSFAKAYASWWRVSRLRRPAAWVMRVTVNGAIDVARRPTAERQLTLVADVTDVAETVVDMSALAAAFATLTARQRDAVVLRHLLGFSENEAALRLGVSVGSVKTHTHRGLQRLRSELGVAESTDEEGPIDAIG